MYNCSISLKTEIEGKINLDLEIFKGSTYANMQSSKVWVFPLATPCKTVFHTSLGIKKNVVNSCFTDSEPADPEK